MSSCLTVCTHKLQQKKHRVWNVLLVIVNIPIHFHSSYTYYEPILYAGPFLLYPMYGHMVSLL